MKTSAFYLAWQPADLLAALSRLGDVRLRSPTRIHLLALLSDFNKIGEELRAYDEQREQVIKRSRGESQ